MSSSSAAVVGAAGGVGATRLAVEFGTLLARDGRSVAVFDAAFATQGLARHVAGHVTDDATSVATGDADPAAARYDHPVTEEVPGRLALCPAFAPFQRIARAKAPAAAERLGECVEAATGTFDHVLVDVPPVATNPAVAAVDATDRVALVYPPTDRGVDALQRARGRLADVDATADCVVANRADGETPPDADHAVPAADAPAPAAATDAAFASAVADAVTALLDASLEVDVDAGLLGSARRRLR
jgi:MinD-like ATPase involved in chromosome partitioning or flagellar assembly